MRLVLLALLLSGCTTTEYIRVPIPLDSKYEQSCIDKASELGYAADFPQVLEARSTDIKALKECDGIRSNLVQLIKEHNEKPSE